MERWFPIQTQRLVLRELVVADAQDIHEYASDPVVSRYDAWGPNSLEQTQEHLARRMAEQRRWPRDEVTLAVELRTENKLIGSFRFAMIDPPNRTAELGFSFNPKYWNNGYATEASRAILDVAFSVLALHRVIATCDVRNVGSWRVMEKIGMRREGHFLRDRLQKGEWRSSYLFAALKPDANS